MNEWIKIEDKEPEDGQDVIYFFDVVGVHRGKYTRAYAERDEFETDEQYEEYKHCYFQCFYGKRGFLCGDVTHWMPDDGREFLPSPPEDYIVDKVTLNDFPVRMNRNYE